MAALDPADRAGALELLEEAPDARAERPCPGNTGAGAGAIAASRARPARATNRTPVARVEAREPVVDARRRAV